MRCDIHILYLYFIMKLDIKICYIICVIIKLSFLWSASNPGKLLNFLIYVYICFIYFFGWEWSTSFVFFPAKYQDLLNLLSSVMSMEESN